MSEKRIIEINGVKMEVDLRHAKKLDTYKIGDNVKVLKKEYGDTYASYPGVIIGFDEFKQLPTIVICYVKTGYDAKVEFAFLNNKTEGIEICHMTSADELIDENKATKYLDREIEKKEAEVLDMKAKRQYFVDNYRRHFKVESPEEAE